MGICKGKFYKFIGKSNGPNFFQSKVYFSHADETLLNAKGIHQPISETMSTSKFQEIIEVHTFICNSCDDGCIVIMNGGDPPIPIRCLYTSKKEPKWSKV